MNTLFFPYTITRPVRQPLRILSLAVALCALAACHSSGAPKVALRPVEALDLSRYMGTWYEIASLPNPFQSHCYDTQAHYALLENGTVEVRNSCHKGSVLGPRKEVVGKAWRPNAASPAALEVQFFWPFKGDYWVLALDDNYQWAVVGGPKRRYLWILARTPHLKEATYEALARRLPEWGYDPTRLEKTVHAAWVEPKKP